MFFPQGLRFKFIGIVLLCISGTIFSTAYYMLDKERELLMDTARQQALSLTKASAIVFTNTLIYEELDMIDESDMVDYLSYYVADVMRTDPRIEAFTVVDKHGRIVVENTVRNDGRESAVPEAVNDTEIELIGQGVDAMFVITKPLAIESKQWGYCRLQFSLEDIEKARIAARNEVFAISGACLLFSLMVIGFSVDYLVKSLQRLSDAMERFTVNGDFSKPFPDLPERKDEIGQLQQSFKWMVKRLHREEQERNRTKEQMFHTEKMATIGQLTASIAHEVNNPLGGVLLCFNNLMKGRLDEDAHRQHVEVINSGLERIRTIMRDLLDYSRQSSLNIQQTDVSDVVHKSLSLLELFSKKRDVDIQVDLPEPLPLIQMDGAKIQQVFVNLLVNAIHATPDGGTITISGQAVEDSFTFLISDTGTGIAPEIQDRIFDPFYTTKDVGQGTGLGLAIAKSLIERHGGKLELRSSDSSGSVFAISFPYSEEGDSA
ncbi:MAG: histidine kinase [Desulfovibrio sp.]|nr:histidine kinase [Desulfovibrio sp.]|tara:strand:- start:16545 stop:18011 length:1467 start_codon:yes stop_codon:yes gene_type:complete